MKKVVVVFLFLMFFVSFAAAGNVLVKSQSGNEIVVNIWPADFGEMVASDKGFASANDSFSASFPGVSSGVYTVQVVVRVGGRTYKMGTFESQDISESLVIDCVSNSSCVFGVEEVVEVVENNSVVNSSVVNDSDDEEVIESSSSVGFVSKSFDVVVDNSLISFGVVPLVLAFLIFMIFRNGNGGGLHRERVESDDALEGVEKKMRDTEDRIKKIKTKKARVKSVELKAAKKKLAGEERELKELEGEGGGDDEEIDEAEKAVEEAEDEIEEAESGVAK